MRNFILGFVALAATAGAQQVVQQTIEIQDKVVQEKAMQDKVHVEAIGGLPGPAPVIARFGGALHAVKGAPYSAETTTETVQVLADGNRIVNKSSNKTYRDSEGRTRVEMTPSTGGAWVPDTKQFSVTLIDDPVSGDHITLNNNDKRATRFSFKGLQDAATTGTASATAKVQTFTTTVTTGSAGAAVMPPLPLPAPAHATGTANTFFVSTGAGTSAGTYVASGVKPDVKTEELGKQAIEGVECTGTRITTTLPAGAVGNERPLETVTENWYSPELQTQVLSKTTDPRFGETTYRLTNIVRAEQPRSLFEVPADYKLEEPAVHITRDVKQQ